MPVKRAASRAPTKAGKKAATTPALTQAKAAANALHAPKTPKGTKFKWFDNDTLDTNPFNLDEPQTLSLKLTDTTGTVHIFDYSSQTIDWSSKEAIFKANTWYNQLIARKLNKPNPNESHATRYRPQWSKQEKDYLENLIKEKIRDKKCKPMTDDWEDIAAKQNNRFLGQSVVPGQALALNNEKTRSKDGISRKRPTAKKKLEIPHRTARSLQSVIRKWPDTTTLINDLLEEYSIIAGYIDEYESSDVF